MVLAEGVILGGIIVESSLDASSLCMVDAKAIRTTTNRRKNVEIAVFLRPHKRYVHYQRQKALVSGTSLDGIMTIPVEFAESSHTQVVKVIKIDMWIKQPVNGYAT